MMTVTGMTRMKGRTMDLVQGMMKPHLQRIPGITRAIKIDNNLPPALGIR